MGLFDLGWVDIEQTGWVVTVGGVEFGSKWEGDGKH